MTTQSISDRQEQIVGLSPATTSEIATELGVTGSTVRDHLSNLSNYDHIDVDRRDLESGEVLYTMNYAGLPGGEDDPAVNHKGKKTRLTRKHLMQREEEMNELLSRTDPIEATIPPTEPGTEDVVVHRTDDHIGALVEDEHGEVLHNIPLVKKKFQHVTEKTLQLIKRQRRAGYDFRGAHLLIGGDVVDGERVYPHQTWEVCATLDEQIDVATELYVEQIKTLAEELEFVQVVCQQGNHGDFGDRTTSKDANADRLLYSRLEFIIGESEYDNVSFVSRGRQEI